MASWTRDTPWRQGSLIGRDDLISLGVDVEEWHEAAVVISHDCDLAHDRLEHEPWAELILLQRLRQYDPNLAHGKNPRQLHFAVAGCGSEPLHFGIHARDRFKLDKNALATREPVPELYPDPVNLEILRRWLADRYRRQALPDVLSARMKPVTDFITRQAKREVTTLIGIWLAVDPMTDLDDGDPYEVDLYFVYSIDEPQAMDAAVSLADKTRQRCGEVEGIYLGECEAVGEDSFTLRDMRRTVELKIEYLSYRGEEPGPMPP
ncbi:hypothetical protein GN155_002930 [Alcanivorax sp. ZXX171]|nr:hypothetical protein [Alcanivorax sp. ZXX171]